jgi:hypothetical protein
MQKEGRVRGSGLGACATGAQTLREFFRQEVRPELRAVAALQLWLVGPQLAILNGVVSLLTSRVENKALATYVSEQSGASANLQLTTGGEYTIRTLKHAKRLRRSHVHGCEAAEIHLGRGSAMCPSGNRR